MGDTHDSLHTASVPPAQAGTRLDKWLAEALPELSRSRLKALIEAGRVSGPGGPVADPAYKVRAGESFAVAIPEAVEAVPRPQSIAIPVVYEDEHLIVVDKPAGMVVHPAPGSPDATLVNALLAHCDGSLSGIGGVKRPGIVHRLDKDTSGLMVVAKTDAAHRGLARQFAEHSLDRAYWALVWGVPKPPRGEVSGNIGRSPADRKKMAVVNRGGKPALTRYRVVKPCGEAAALVECRLATGRTHQIRVHMSAIGHPLIGDPAYGRPTAARLRALSPEARQAVQAFGRQALHAYLIGFSHPITGERLQYESPMTYDFRGLLSKLERL